MEVRLGMDGTGHIQSHPECLALSITPQTRVQPTNQLRGEPKNCLNRKMLLSLNNIAHHIKHSDSPHLANSSSYGALDLSNDEAQHPSQVTYNYVVLTDGGLFQFVEINQMKYSYP